MCNPCKFLLNFRPAYRPRVMLQRSIRAVVYKASTCLVRRNFTELPFKDSPIAGTISKNEVVGKREIFCVILPQNPTTEMCI